MPHICQHCDTTLSTKQKLQIHQTSAQYCLEIQKKKGLVSKISQHECKCGSKYTQHGSLKRHEKTCSMIISIQGSHNNIDQSTTTNIANNITNNITNNICIAPVKPFTMQDLTRPYILERLTPVITKEIVKAGMGAITEMVVEILLQKDGKYCYYCSDKSRKKFTMLIDHEGQVIEKSDPNAQVLKGILSIRSLKSGKSGIPYSH